MPKDTRQTPYSNRHCFEIVEFIIANATYGINVAKVREVINLLPVTQVPKTHPYVEGVFTLRGKVLPLVNLSNCLQIKDTDPKRIVIVELNNYRVGFLVDEVLKIQHIDWDQVEPTPEITKSNLIIGIIKIKDRVTILLDFENIIYSINPEISTIFSNFKPNINEKELQKRQEKTLMIVEDSPFITDLMIQTLNTAGYTNIIVQNNGKDALEYLEKIKREYDNILEAVQIIVVDLEMPCIDGKSLVKLLSNDEKLKVLPVIIFSSLISDKEENIDKNIGATAQITKLKVEELIQTITKYIK